VENYINVEEYNFLPNTEAKEFTPSLPSLPVMSLVGLFLQHSVMDSEISQSAA
jgi:hypothetical protein